MSWFQPQCVCYFRQLSGIGASGTFQLIDRFFPSPAILAGDSSDSEEEDEEVNSDDEPEYVPRPTKRTKSASKPKSQKSSVAQPAKRGKPNPKVEEKKKGNVKSNDKNVKARKDRKVAAASESESEEEEVEYIPSPTKRRGGTSTQVKPRNQVSTKKTKASPQKGRGKSVSNKKGTNKSKRSASISQAVIYSDGEDYTEVEYTPRASKSRGGSGAQKLTPRSSAARNAKRSMIDDGLDADDDASDVETAPAPPKKRKSGQTDVKKETKKSPKARSSKRRR